MPLNSILGRFFAVLTLAWPLAGFSQLQLPFEVKASHPITDATGDLLPGANPNAAAFGEAVVQGCVVQLINAGEDGIADWPGADGAVSGDDSLLFTTSIGYGIIPTDELTGQLNASITPPPALGTWLYARVFNTPNISNATHWGQSSVFQVQSLVTIDLSLFGLIAATIPMNANPLTSDSDADGASDSAELAANTNASDPNDVPLVSRLWLVDEVASLVGDSIPDGETPGASTASDVEQDAVVEFPGKIGRRYILQRTTSMENPVSWDNILDTGVLTASTYLQLTDEEPPQEGRALYRIQILQP